MIVSTALMQVPAEGGESDEEVGFSSNEAFPQDYSFKADVFAKQKELQCLQASLSKLMEVQATRPLQASLEERLRVHAVRARISQLVQDLEEQELAPDVEAGNNVVDHAPSSKWHITGTHGRAAGKVVLLLKDLRKSQGQDFGLPVQSEHDRAGTDAGCNDEEQLAAAHLAEPELVCMKIVLGRSFPIEVTDDILSKLLPFFSVEQKPKGSLIVRAEGSSNTIWLIKRGRCAILAEGNKTDKKLATNKSAASSRALQRREDRDMSFMKVKDGNNVLGLLEEGQFIGLISGLLHEQEPAAIYVDSPEAVFLAIRTENLLGKAPKQLVEALKDMTRAQLTWLESRALRLAELPMQVNKRTDRIRNETYQARIPRMIDSPFLRRKPQAGFSQGMFSMEAVCRHFAGMVHPESEWLYSAQSRGFYENMQLGLSSSKKAAVKANTPSANSRFVYFKHLDATLAEHNHWGRDTKHVISPAPSLQQQTALFGGNVLDWIRDGLLLPPSQGSCLPASTNENVASFDAKVLGQRLASAQNNSDQLNSSSVSSWLPIDRNQLLGDMRHSTAYEVVGQQLEMHQTEERAKKVDADFRKAFHAGGGVLPTLAAGVQMYRSRAMQLKSSGFLPSEENSNENMPPLDCQVEEPTYFLSSRRDDWDRMPLSKSGLPPINPADVIQWAKGNTLRKTRVTRIKPQATYGQRSFRPDIGLALNSEGNHTSPGRIRQQGCLHKGPVSKRRHGLSSRDNLEAVARVLLRDERQTKSEQHNDVTAWDWGEMDLRSSASLRSQNGEAEAVVPTSPGWHQIESDLDFEDFGEDVSDDGIDTWADGTVEQFEDDEYQNSTQR